MYVSVITDEVSQDLEYTLNFLRKLDVKFIELKSIWNKNIVKLNEEELQRIQEMINETGFRVSCLAAPIFKCFLNENERTITGDKFFVEEDTFEQHLNLLETAKNLCKVFKTDKLRIFPFWKVRDLETSWKEIMEKLNLASKLTKNRKLILALENEHICNLIGTNIILKFFREVKSSNIKLLWDPCNSFVSNVDIFGELNEVKKFICHIHAKNIKLDPLNGNYYYTGLQDGLIDYENLLKSIDINIAVSLEAHFGNTKNKDKKLKNSIKYLKQICQEH